MTNNKLKEEILKSKYLHSLSKLEKEWIYECMESYHRQRVEEIEKTIYKEFPTDADDIHAGFWETEHIIRENVYKKQGAKVILEKLKQL